MFQQYLQYILNRGRIQLVVILRSIILILIALTISSGQMSIPLWIALLGTYFANGYLIRSKMDPSDPVDLKRYFIFFLWMCLACFVMLLVINLFVSPFITPELQAQFEKHSQDRTQPLPPELSRLLLVSFFVIGLVYSLVVPVWIAKANVLQGIRALPSYLVRADYIQAAWTPYVILFVPVLILFLISGSEEMRLSFWGQILGLVLLFFTLTFDVILQFPVFHIVRGELKRREESNNSEA
ncbi:hypothetical protein EHQ27_07645 [Leptospira wolffii]|uniref:hypothetical protein n=1 Tax=Leptospira wolffii TaxID=409998 RepID=UPI0002DA3212|nr:hypothetical protein [Leptospira wolffii]EPG65785.1 putative membrane protein [Leptospira wolffii serovar Khorat str. Khorat-H2]TGK64682.1 hypothetical protein EHQ32_00210 [Leptospira wolffii]TGK72770.1 hypothetical protein EHQ27_07645 [Leptospira wolffii]TGK76919.1 hypothetical protein EHQ35_01005 [Leptospira wolffii]TGL26624.1 hypothetical protein EHQ57_18045 [Leptospira wolffii]